MRASPALLRVWIVFSAVALASGARLRQQRNTSNVSSVQAPVTFQGWYSTHNAGRGIWKWSNSLDAYQRHFAQFQNLPVSVGEVGVQSGGSILMWKAFFGAQLKMYGLDINPACKQFEDATTVITIGDQGDQNMWNSFYTHVTPTLDILVDDGSHQPHHMGITLHVSFPKINPGGFIAVEDIHGRHFVQSFFTPAAQSIDAWHAQSLVASVHVYPYQLVVHKAGGTSPALDIPAVAATIDGFPALYALLTTLPGQYVEIVNPTWGSFLSQATLTKIFTELAPLHDMQTWAEPVGCCTTAAPVCVNTVTNSNYQAHVIGVHIFPTRAVVEIAAAPPVIAATRKGTEWIAYR